MATNRYTDLSVSAYNPLSLQEIMFAPSMMRQNHDKLSESLALSQGLIKPDPLDVHTTEALELKNQYDQKLAEQADLLASKGFNSNTSSSIRQTNREIQNLMSPTGRIGQINNAKKVYLDNRKEFLDDATKTKGWSMERALNAWTNFSSKEAYSGYDDKNNISTIGLLGAPVKINVMDKLKNVHDILGEQVVGEMRSSGYSFAPGPNGSTIMVDRSGRRITTSNKPNLQSAISLLENQFNEKEWTDSRKFEEANDSNVKNQIINGVNSMLKTGVVDNRSENAQYIAPKEGSNDETTNLDAVNVEGVDITKNSNLLNRLNGGSGGIMSKDEKELKEGNAFGSPFKLDINSKNEVLDDPEYKALAYGLARADKSLTGKNFKSPEVQAAVKKYLKENENVVVQNRYTDPNTNKTAFLFASKEIPKDKKAASDLILERAQQGAYEVRDIDGKLIDPIELGKYNFTYSGDMTPKSQIGNIFSNPKQNIGARRGILIDKNSNEATKVYISRSSDDFDTPQYKAMAIISGISKITDIQPGAYHKLKSPLFDAYGMTNVEIKYNKNKQTYDMSYTENGKVIDNNNIPDEVFQQTILEDYEKLYN